MQNLQDLYEFYLQTKPSKGKVQAATRFLIHICRYLQVSSPEEVTPDRFGEIPEAIESHHELAYHSAIQEKSILAEMIGRYGPRDGWEKVLDILLTDKDDNLRQFTLQALAYSVCDQLESIISYLERFKDGEHPLMRQVTASLIAKVLVQKGCEQLKSRIVLWAQQGDPAMIQQIYDHVQTISLSTADYSQAAKVTRWFLSTFPFLAASGFSE